MRGQGCSDYHLSKQFAERLIDWVAAGYTLIHHPN
jgi:hypothetical protein